MSEFDNYYQLFSISIEKDKEIIEKIKGDADQKFEFIEYLRERLKDPNEIEKCSKFIAELSKTEDLRERFTQQEFLNDLNHNLSIQSISNKAKIQLCRAIGNICYYNDDARLKILNSNDGLNPIINLIKSINEQEISIDEEFLLIVVLGCLHNISNENDTLSSELANHQIVSLLKTFMLKYLSRNNPNMTKYLISCLENLIDINEKIKNDFCELNVACSIYSNMNKEFLLSLNDDYEELFGFFDFINNLKGTKRLLCQTEFIDLILNIMSSSNDTELVRHSGLFITTLLTSDSVDEDMSIIFDYKNKLILNVALDWLSTDNNSEQLYLTAAVVIANYTRSDKDVDFLIKHEKKPHLKLIELVKSYEKIEAEKHTLDKFNLIHSLLGALRNFCISVSNRKEIIESGLVDIVLPYLKWSNLDVNFKAIAILRLLVKNCTKDAELKQLSELENLKIIEQFALKSEHPGVIGEATRLICYLAVIAVKFPTLSLLNKFQISSIYKVMLNQLKSEHLIMVNEGLLGLNLCVNSAYELCHEKLKEFCLNDAIKQLIERDKVPSEIQSNLLKLFGFILQKNKFFDKDQLMDFSNLFKQKLQKGETEPIIRIQIEQILMYINSNT